MSGLTLRIVGVRLPPARMSFAVVTRRLAFIPAS
jgi:hypothetical protein